MSWKLMPLVAVLFGISVVLPACKPENLTAETTTGNAAPKALLKFQALAVGNAINADRSVPPLTMFAPGDKIIASVRTNGIANDVPVSVKLIAMANGQVLGELSRKVATTGPATTNFEFPKSGPWAVGRYLVEVAVNGKFETRQEIEVRERAPNTTPDPAPPAH